LCLVGHGAFNECRAVNNVEKKPPQRLMLIKRRLATHLVWSMPKGVRAAFIQGGERNDIS
jgi:hypothetical protein